MSATSVMVMLVVTELFAVSGSAVSEVTEAVLVTGPKSGALMRIESAGASPRGRRPAAVQVTTPATGGLHVHPSPDPEAVVTPTGSVCVTVTPEAGSGPALVTITLQVSGNPALTGTGELHIAIERSADAAAGARTVSSTAVLLPSTGSRVVEETLAVLLSRPPPAGIPVSAMSGAAPTGSSLREQVRTPSATSLHAQPDPHPVTPVRPVGSATVTMTEVAVPGPAFVTVRA
jgi:hypothetical protein